MKKIATLIPAYKSEYFAELLYCLQNQTYKHFRILISDDSPGAKITALLQSPNGLRWSKAWK